MKKLGYIKGTRDELRTRRYAGTSRLPLLPSLTMLSLVVQARQALNV